MIYNICKNCVMDTTDSNIIFDDSGVCDHCNTFYSHTLPNWQIGKDGENELKALTKKIIPVRKGKKDDINLHRKQVDQKETSLRH